MSIAGLIELRGKGCAVAAMALLFASPQAAPAQQAGNLPDSRHNSPGGQPSPAGLEMNRVPAASGRKMILSKLARIQLDEASFDLPLPEVLKKLRAESIKRDPDGVGVNFMIVGRDAAGGTGAPVDMSQITITISPPLKNLRLVDVLDAITKVADKPIRYTIEEYAVVFSPRPAGEAQFYTRKFRVDPNAFNQGLENVVAVPLNFGAQTTGGGGAGGGGGNGASLGGTIPQVQIAPVTQGGQQGGGGR